MTQAQRADKYKQKHMAKGLCRNCPRKARPGTTLCVQCRAKAKLARQRYMPQQREVRAYRLSLGFCVYCKEKAEPGYGMCARHLIKNREACNRRREKQIKQRGWKLVKVKV